jgi:4-alpha-glucanotransferase
MRFTRSSGILLHPTSLPGPFGSGDFGAPSYHFIDWLSKAGQSLWQMLPLGPIGWANSPYMSLSAFAGNPLLIDLYGLVSNGWLLQNELDDTLFKIHNSINYQEVIPFRMNMLVKAFNNFVNQSNTDFQSQYITYCMREKFWLDDYALFQALNKKYGGEEWTSWEHDIAKRDPNAIIKATEELKEHIEFHKFTQWCFDSQWKKIKSYALAHGIKIIGDIPIFVSQHSSDVWSNPQMFELDNDGVPKLVAGVPPDYFSESGQRWGNPLYRWDIMKQDNYRWWIGRFRKALEMFDIVRIDHFRGFESYWEIPETEETAKIGKWKKGPGAVFFKTVKEVLGTLPIIAEDLGIITPEVTALREKLNFPGMKVLQFAFTGGPENLFLPHNFERNSVVYTGTHDNDTTYGWYANATDHERDFVRRYCKTDGHEIHWDLIKLALQSPANVAVIPFQDVIGLGSEGRMNFPGTIEGNWEWRFTWDQVGPEPAERLYELSALYGRFSSNRLNLK